MQIRGVAQGRIFGACMIRYIRQSLELYTDGQPLSPRSDSRMMLTDHVLAKYALYVLHSLLCPIGRNLSHYLCTRLGWAASSSQALAACER